MKQNREPRNKPTLIGSTNLGTKEAKIYNGEEIVSSIFGVKSLSISSVKKTGHTHAKE